CAGYWWHHLLQHAAAARRVPEPGEQLASSGLQPPPAGVLQPVCSELHSDADSSHVPAAATAPAPPASATPPAAATAAAAPPASAAPAPGPTVQQAVLGKAV
ncbi:hypothetical protein GGH92_010560, partial [Coemansia sp. RSA 2673]